MYHSASTNIHHLPQLSGKTDQRFVEAAFKLFRDHLNVKTALTPAHFLNQVGGSGTLQVNSKPSTAFNMPQQMEIMWDVFTGPD